MIGWARLIEQGTTVHTPAIVAVFGADGHVRKLDDILREAIDLALLLNNGNVGATARQLGIGRGTLYRRFKVGKREGR